eukprot:CAMPEP_0113542252 /NCGR_PEP_ID=MMETSP0015_2-20120614/9500_1 /TAXON_ID=2838 /ORGANISM="Odontella" /LENGTH=163 /DNA_ID=CAMNT_0000442281 /DNA_START=201 /DNA_END=692 /DNA_ORIENTATION=- /assembly_acc=CAM_ASM_000160
MKISWISALVVLPAAAATASPGGGVSFCVKFGAGEVELKGGEEITKNTGICTDSLTLGITGGKGKLQLLEGDDVLWKAKDEGGNVVEGLKECRMQVGGAFVCKDKDEHPLWALNCGGNDGSYMHLIDDGDDIVLRMRNNINAFKVDEEGNEVGTCRSPSYEKD